MARKTVAEIRAENRQRDIDAYEESKRTWRARLFDVMREARQISVTENNEFWVEIFDENNDYFRHEFPIDLPSEYDPEHRSLIWSLESFEGIIERVKNYRLEQERLTKIRLDALAKLTNEEKVALGLNKSFY